MSSIDWDDIETCTDCENNFDIAELNDISGELVCENCTKNRG